MIIENNKKKLAWRRVATCLFIFLLAGSFLFYSSAKAAVTGDYNKPINGTLSSSEWNNLIKDFISVNGGRIDGALGINTATSSSYALDISGAVRATTFTGSYSGTLNSGNVSAGAFGSNTGGGNFTFPGNVGVGTTNPQAALYIANDVSIAQSVANPVVSQIIASNKNNGGRLYIGNAYTGGVSTYSFLQSSDYYSSADHYGNLFLNPNGGSVGIGTTTTGSYKLFVNGSANFTGTVSAGSFSGPMSGTLSSGNVSAGTFGSNTGGGNYAFTGNLGIGTTNAYQGRAMINGDLWFNGPNKIAFSTDGSTDSTPNVSLEATSSNLLFGSWTGSAFTYKMAILGTSGNVGIGTTNPRAQLDIYGNSNGGRIDSLSLSNAGTNNDSATAIYMGYQQAGLGYYGARILQKGYPSSTRSADLLFQIHDTPGDNADTSWITPLMIQRNTGNVGIGTTNPSTAKLVIAPSGSYSIDASGGRIGNITSVNDTDAASVAYVKAVVGGTSTIPTVGYWTQSGSNIYNSNGGNVGIGTTTPGSYKLFVNGNTNINGTLSASSFSGPLAGTVNSTNVSAGEFGASTGGGNYIFGATVPGNVGIGTTTPSAKLHVSVGQYKDVYIGNGGAIGAPDLSVLGASVMFTRTTTQFADSGIAGYTSSAGGNNLAVKARSDIVFVTGNLNDERMRIKELGNVGIGTANPSQKLDVNGNANVSGTVTAGSFSGPLSGTLSSGNVSAGAFGSNTGGGNYSFPANVGIGTTAPAKLLDVNGQSLFRDYQSLYYGTTLAGKIGASYNITTPGGGSDVSLTAVNSIYFAPGSTTTPAVVFNNSGNVGIGTNSPQNKFQIFKASTWSSEGTAALSILSAALDTEMLLGTDSTSDVGYIQTLQDATSYNNRPLVIQPNGGSVGIGTTTVGSYKLFVNGTANFTGTVSAGSFSGPLSGTLSSGNVSAGTFGSNTGGGNYAFTGNVGIGTTNPGAKLDVVGDLYVDADWSNDTAIRIREGGDSTYGAFFKYGSGDLLTIGTRNGVASDTVAMQISRGSQNVIFNGNIGIGTTNPGYKFEVGGNAQTSVFQGINIDGNRIYTAGQYGTARLGFSLSEGTSISSVSRPFAYIESGNESDTSSANGFLAFGNRLAGTIGEKMRITSGGNVGIGTTNPSTAKLVITPSGSYSIDAGGGRVGNITSVADTDAASVAYVKAVVGGTSTIPTVGYWTASGNNIYNANGGGVAIGTTTPGSYKLFVNGNSNINGTLSASSFSGPLTGTVNSTNVSAGAFAANTGGGNFSFPASLGVGTTTPNEKLQVIGNLNVSDNGSANYDLKIKMNGKAALTSFNTQTSPDNTILSINRDWDSTQGYHSDFSTVSIGGNVGIGTTNPSQKLDVNGNANVSGTVTAGSFSGPMSGTLSSGNVSAGTFGSNTGGGNYAFTGNVGVGTTTPATKLDITTSGVSGLLLNQDTGTPTNSARLFFKNSNSTFAIMSSGSALNFNYGATVGSTSGTNAMTITSSGNVGIGTSPAQKLDVSGIVKANHFYTGYNWTTKTGGFNFGVDGINGGLGFYDGVTPSSASIFREATTSNFYVGVRGGDVTQGITVNNSGSVGIGITSPAYKLDVNGDVHLTGTLYAGALSGGAMTGTINSANVSSGTFGSNTGGGNFSLLGNFGIGTTNPTAKLDVVGGNIDIDNTTFASQTGVITKNGTRFIHDFNYGNNGTVTTDGANTFIGRNAGNFTMGSTATATYQASYNSALGIQSLQNNTTGYQNSAFGSYSLQNNTTGPQNSALGYASLYSNTTGASNSAVGFQSIYYNTTGGNNSAMGNYSLSSNVAGNNGVAVGYESQRYVNSTTTAWTNTNTSVGYQSLRGSGTAANNTGNGNTAMGYASLYANTTGGGNSALGYAALQWNTTGANNSAFGYGSLTNSSTGNNNSAVGLLSLNSITTGSQNSAIGQSAGRYIADGSTANQTSSNSIYLGYNTKALADGDTNETVIGYNAVGIGSNSVVLGNDSVTTTALKGNVGIGTTNPGSYKLFVNGNANFTGTVTAGSFSGPMSGTLSSGNVSAGAFGSNTGGGNYTFPGNVGIGTTAPLARFHISDSGVDKDGFNAANGNLIIQANTGSRSQTVGSQIEFMIPADSNGGNMWGQSRIITVAGNTSSGNATGMMILGTRRYFDKLGTGGHWYYGDDLTINGSGNIGISTTTPAAKLDVNGDTNITGNLNVTGTITGGAAMTGTLNAGNVSAGTFGSNTGNGNFALMGNFGIGTATPSSKVEIQGGPLRLTGSYLDINRNGSASSGISWYNQGFNAWATYMSPAGAGMGPKGNLTAPSGTLVTAWALRNFIENNSGYGWTFESGTNYSTTPAVKFEILSSNGTIHSYGNGLFDGSVGIGTTNPSEAKLVISAGTGMALKAYGNGIFTGTLQTQTGSDFAEEFTTSKDLEQGTVVVMDDNGHKSVRPCNKSYDKTVVGIVSNNPSIIAGRVTSEHKAIIAMMGVVKVKVVDINGTIAKGDLLTTSGVYGYAMKAAKEKPGTIIGKALEDLNSKSGQINVLVNLQ